MNLKEFEVFDKFDHKHKSKILNFIEYCYNKDSQLWKTFYGDLVKIRRQAAIKAELDPDEDWVKKIVELKNKDVNELINTYICRVQNNNEFDLLVSDQHLLWELSEQIRKTEESTGDPMEKFKAKTYYSETADKVSKRVRERLDLIFFREDLLREQQEEKIRKTVEDRVMEFEEYKIKPKKDEEFVV